MLKPIPTATSTTPDFLLSIIINYISCVCASVQWQITDDVNMW